MPRSAEIFRDLGSLATVRVPYLFIVKIGIDYLHIRLLWQIGTNDRDSAYREDQLIDDRRLWCNLQAVAKQFQETPGQSLVRAKKVL